MDKPLQPRGDHLSSELWTTAQEDLPEAAQAVLDPKAKADPGAFVKYDGGKPRLDLLPPGALIEIAKVLEHGAVKYALNNWVKGAAWSRYYAALQRHLQAWALCEDDDPDTGLYHLAHAGCCLTFLLQYQISSIGTDDRIGHVINEHSKVGNGDLDRDR